MLHYEKGIVQWTVLKTQMNVELGTFKHHWIMYLLHASLVGKQGLLKLLYGGGRNCYR